MRFLRQGLVAVAMLVATAPALLAQRRLTGRVTEEGSNAPLGSVSVQVTGIINGTYTSTDGAFSLSVPNGAVSLRVRRIGYSMRTVLVQANQSTVTVALRKDVLQLETQIVTGQQGTLDRRNAATAVVLVTSEDLNRVPAQSLEQVLQGKVVGARINMNSGAPGGGGQIQFRGVTSVLGNGEPLYVIDGVLMSNASIASGANTLTRAAGAAGNIASAQDNRTNRLADINPSEIEDVQVLKGAAASALYGSRATNGVVIITTKRGKSGTPRWSLTQRVGQASLLRDVGQRCFRDTTDALAAGTASSNAVIARDVLTAAISANGGVIPCNNFSRQLFGDRAPAYETGLQVSGGNEQTRYLAALSRKYDAGTANNTNATRDNARINIDQNISSRLTARLDLAYTRSQSNRGLSNNGNDPNTSPGYVFAKTPSFIQLQNRDSAGLFPINRFGGVGSNFANTSNPFQTFEFITNNEDVNRIVGAASLNYQVLANEKQQLRVEYFAGLDRFDQVNNILSPSILQFEAVDGLPGTSVFSNSVSRQLNQALRAYWTVTPAKLGATFNTIIGLTEEEQGLNVTRNRAQNLLSGVPNISQGQQLSFQNRELQRDQAWFLNQSVLAFDDKLYVAAGVRGDRSSNNGDVGKYYVFPTAQASYRLVSLIPGIDETKLRASWGQTGNRPLYGQRNITFAPVNLIGGFNGIGVNAGLGNPAVAPERKTELEFGVDVTALSRRLAFEYTYADARIDDVLFQRPIPPTAGVNSQIFNGGVLRNKSHEAGVTIVPVQTKGFTWVSRTSYQRIRNNVQALPIPPFNVGNTGFGAGFGRSRIAQGVSTTAIWGNRPIIVRTAAGRDSIFTRDTIIGDGNPNFELSFTNTYTISRFTLNVQVDYRNGGDLVNLTQQINDQFQNSRDYDAPSPCRGQTAANLSCIRNAGGVIALLDTSATAKLGAYRFTRWNASSNASPYTQDGSFVKLREVSLGYAVPTDVIRKLFGSRISDVRLNVVGRNLGIWSPYWGVDPEVNNFGNNNVGRFVDLAPFPPNRQFFFSVDLGF